MKRKKNAYRNSLKTGSLVFWVLLASMVGVVGASYVHVKNRHVAKGDEIREFEREIQELDQEVEMIELRIAGLLDRSELSRRLSQADSALKKIDQTAVINLRPDTELREVAEAGSWDPPTN